MTYQKEALKKETEMGTDVTAAQFIDSLERLLEPWEFTALTLMAAADEMGWNSTENSLWGDDEGRL